MAETENNAQNDAQTDVQKKADRQLIVHAQYIKDFSFENPNAPKVLVENPGQPDVQINVSVAAKLIGENQYEVLLNLGAKAVADETPMFLVDLTYAGLVSPQGVTGDDINPLIMIEAPRLLFPFARALVSDDASPRPRPCLACSAGRGGRPRRRGLRRGSGAHRTTGEIRTLWTRDVGVVRTVFFTLVFDM